MNRLTTEATKRQFSNRSVVCAPCIAPEDEQLGFSFTTRECGRCQETIEVGVGVVVMQPASKRKK